MPLGWLVWLLGLGVAVAGYWAIRSRGDALNRRFEAAVAAYLAGERKDLATDEATLRAFGSLIVLQLPLILVFAATANWRSASPALLIGAQFLGIAIACIPVWLAGY